METPLQYTCHANADRYKGVCGGGHCILHRWMSGIRRDGPQLRINPATDLEFEGLALGLAIDVLATPETLQAELRRTFPKVVVRRRELSGEPVQVWYVYREGHWVSVVTGDLDSPPEIKRSRRD